MHHYYLYQHTRLDTNEIFYIGIGKKLPAHKIWKHNTEFSRAYERTKRSKFWKNITAKTKIRVDILQESDDEVYIKQKEIELIAQYGRRCCDTGGTLVNFSKGGEIGNGGYPIYRDIRIEQISLAGVSLKIWDQPNQIEKQLGYLKTNIVKCCRGKQLTAYGYKWRYADNRAFDVSWPSAARYKTTNRGVGIIVVNRRTGEKLIFRTLQSCADYLRFNRTTISRYLSGKSVNKLYNFEYGKW